MLGVDTSPPKEFGAAALKILHKNAEAAFGSGQSPHVATFAGGIDRYYAM